MVRPVKPPRKHTMGRGRVNGDRPGSIVIQVKIPFSVKETEMLGSLMGLSERAHREQLRDWVQDLVSAELGSLVKELDRLS